MRLKQVVIGGPRVDQQWRGIPSIERSSGGRLFVSWFSGGKIEPEEANRVYLQTSDDDGRSFSDPMVMCDPEGKTRAFDPCLWFDPRGRLWYIYNVGNREENQHGVWAQCCSEPDAPQLQWSEPKRLGFDVPFSFRSNKPTVLSTGEWLLPVTWAEDTRGDWFAGDRQLQGCAISEDEGETWTLHGAVKAPSWALECMFVELRSGDVRMYTRCGGGVIDESLSTDRGRTWSEARPTTITNPGSRFFVRILASGRWLLINSPDRKARTGMVAMLSEDEGQSWSAPLMLDERTNVSYPDACQTTEGLIYAVHDRERQGAMEVLLSIFSEQDIVPGLP